MDDLWCFPAPVFSINNSKDPSVRAFGWSHTPVQYTVCDWSLAKLWIVGIYYTSKYIRLSSRTYIAGLSNYMVALLQLSGGSISNFNILLLKKFLLSLLAHLTSRIFCCVSWRAEGGHSLTTLTELWTLITHLYPD